VQFFRNLSLSLVGDENSFNTPGNERPDLFALFTALPPSRSRVLLITLLYYGRSPTLNRDSSVLEEYGIRAEPAYRGENTFPRARAVFSRFFGGVRITDG